MNIPQIQDTIFYTHRESKVMNDATVVKITLRPSLSFGSSNPKHTHAGQLKFSLTLCDDILMNTILLIIINEHIESNAIAIFDVRSAKSRE